MVATPAAMDEAAALRRKVVSAPRIDVNRAMVVVSAAWLALVVLAAAVPGLLSPDDVALPVPTRSLQPPGQTLLGADQYGRDVLALIVHGARSALVIGLAATAVGALIGSTLGLVAGYLGGWVDMVVGRIVDALMCFPGVLLALVIAAGLGATTTNLVIAVGIATVPAFTRVMRGQVLSVRGRLYVEAARSVGIGPGRVLMRHVLPNVLAPTVVLATISVGTAIVVAASLSFLGLGPRMDVPDWGQLLAMGQPYLSSAWWISTFPGLVLTLTVIAVSLLGDWLRDRLDID